VSSARVHPTAVVDPGAEVEGDVEIGPLCHVGAGVTLGRGTRLLGSCTVLGPTTLGAKNVVHPYAVLGGAPQDRSHAGEATTLRIGDDNEFREHVTVHRGTAKDRGETRIGSGGLFMAGAHIAHDCVIGDGVVLANATLLGGHVVLGDGVVTGGRAGFVPYVRVGRFAFIAGAAVVERDVPPFVIAAGDRARVRAPNHVGLRRHGVPEASIAALEEAFRAVFVGKRAIPPEVARDPFVQELLAAVT
jgi:UDP-N-acetylglucosamine acyltransferase